MNGKRRTYRWMCVVCLGLAAGGLAAVPAAAAQTCGEVVPEAPQCSFVLAIDCSASMAGEPLERARQGAEAFTDRLRPGDRAAVVAFANDVRVLVPLTTDQTQLKTAIRSLRATGSTVLYDGMARGAALVRSATGPRIVVFLTDGVDTGSLCRPVEVGGLSRSEAVFLYGIGLGQVDAVALASLTEATGGTFELATRAADLPGIYQRTMDSYLTRYAARAAQRGGLTVKSIPPGRAVAIADRPAGCTPLKLDDLAPGSYPVSVDFGRGRWRCAAVVTAAHRTTLDVREDDLGPDLWVVSSPSGALVFLDSAYVGVTAPCVVSPGQKRWGRAIRAQSAQLHLRFVPPGVHHLRLVGLPDFNYGPDQQFAFELDMAGRQRVVWVDILGRRVAMDDGSADQQSTIDRIDDAMDQLDQETAGDPDDNAAASAGAAEPAGDTASGGAEFLDTGSAAADSLLEP